MDLIEEDLKKNAAARKALEDSVRSIKEKGVPMVHFMAPEGSLVISPHMVDEDDVLAMFMKWCAEYFPNLAE